jgi:integrase
MAGRIFKREGTKYWWIPYHINGIEYRESSGTEDRAVAEALLAKRVRQRYEVGQAGWTPMTDLLDVLLEDYRIRGHKTLRHAFYRIGALKRRIGDIRAVDVTASWIRRYVTRRLDEGARPATINRELAALRRAMNIARAEGLLTVVPPFPRLRENNVRRRFFEIYEVGLLIRTLPDYLQDLVLFAFMTGWRKGEVLGLRWEMVDMAAQTITLPTSKNDRGRVLALRGELWALIQRRYEDRVEVPWVFHRYGQRIMDFKDAWKTARKVTGLSARVFHDFRRTGARNLIRAGVPERIAMEITGHKTRSVFDRYNIVDEDDIADAVERLSGFLSESPPKRRKTTRYPCDFIDVRSTQNPAGVSPPCRFESDLRHQKINGLPQSFSPLENGPSYKMSWICHDLLLLQGSPLCQTLMVSLQAS